MARKTYDLSNSYDVAVIRNLLEEDRVEDPALTEDLGEESDIDSHDEVEERNEDSATEQEEGGISEDEEEESRSNSFFLGKDNLTKWTKKPSLAAHHTQFHIIRHLPSVKGDAKNAKTILECWKCLFDTEILELIVKYTNQYIDSIKARYARERDVKETDVIEIMAFIGLLYLAGAYRANRQSLGELWGTEGDGIEKFGLVMSIKRFRFLIRCIRFDDRSSRAQRKEYDRLCPIRELFERFVHNCQKNYNVGEIVTVDEMLLGFRGKCPFRQYIPSKPTKYGIKTFALVDARTLYMYNLEVYAGRQPEGPFLINNKPSEVVKRMAGPLFGTGRNITASNWFSDIDLVTDLKEKNLSYVGAVRKDKRQLPASFVSTRRRAQFSSLFGFNNGNALVSYVPKKGETVILISSLSETDTIDQSSGEKQEPELLAFYNCTKGGVDAADQMCATYSVSRNTRRWPLIIFFTCLNVAGINSQVISIGNKLEPMKRRIFLKTLSHQLVSGHLATRSLSTSGIPSQLQVRLKRFLPPQEPVPEVSISSHPPKRRKCGMCMAEAGFRRMTNYECQHCRLPICLSHVYPLCQTCFSNVDIKYSTTVSAHDFDE